MMPTDKKENQEPMVIVSLKEYDAMRAKNKELEKELSKKQDVLIKLFWIMFRSNFAGDQAKTEKIILKMMEGKFEPDDFFFVDREDHMIFSLQYKFEKDELNENK